MRGAVGVERRHWPWIFGCVPALLALPAPASAHLMNTGFGPFYDGLAHFFATPGDLLPALALALLGGMRGPHTARMVVLVLPLAWLVASLAGLIGVWQPNVAAATATVTVVLGALVAADMPLPVAAVTGMALALGLVHGAVDGGEWAKAPGSHLALAGVACAVFVLVSLLGGEIASIRRPWARVVVRAAGSWIAAIGLLMLGWSLARGAPPG